MENILSVMFIIVIVLLISNNNVLLSKNLETNLVVDQTGTFKGSVKTISDAINIAPNNSKTPFVIHIKKGVYMEDRLVVSQEKTNIWFTGDGIGQTIISGNRCVNGSKVVLLKDTATFYSFGAGTVLQGMTIENTAGPGAGQAIALGIEADKVIVYSCNVTGYQDTLFVSFGRQYFRESYIFGTVDFIFGDATIVFQKCDIMANKPIIGQSVTITAQSREVQSITSGMVFQGCNLQPSPELKKVLPLVKTYLGRPWRAYSRVVFMESIIGSHVDPKGWLEWTVPLDNLYYAEFQNTGPGSNITNRANWTSVHPNITIEEARRFTVSQFIQGDTWINGTGVPYYGGLAA